MKEITGYIQFYSKKGRDTIVEKSQKVLDDTGMKIIKDELLAIVDELIKNAIKANYKFLLIKEIIHRSVLAKNPMLKSEQIEMKVSEIIKNKRLFKSAVRDIKLTHNIDDKIRETLQEEAKFLSIKNRADRENRSFTYEESSRIMEFTKLLAMKKRINENKTRIRLTIKSDKKNLYIDVTNTSPLLAEDLKKIEKKRKEFRKFHDKHKTHEFFINNLSDSETGYGLGYAKIDSILFDWGLEPNQAAQISTSIDTSVLLKLPLDKLKEKYRR